MRERDELVTITVRRGDLAVAVAALRDAHADYWDAADRLEQQLELTMARTAYLHSTRRAMLGLEWDDLPAHERLPWIERAIAKAGR